MNYDQYMRELRVRLLTLTQELYANPNASLHIAEEIEENVKYLLLFIKREKKEKQK